MSVLIHQPIRRLFVWALIIISILLTQTIAQATQVTLSWDPNNSNPDACHVCQRIEGQSYNYSSPVWPQQGDDPTQTHCTISNLVDSISYYHVVPAFQVAKESPHSNEANHFPGQTVAEVYDITSNQNIAKMVIKMLCNLFNLLPENWPLLASLMLISILKSALLAFFRSKADLLKSYSIYIKLNRRCRDACHLQPEEERRGKNDSCFPVYIKKRKWYFFCFIVFSFLYCIAHAKAFNFKLKFRG